MLVLLSVPILGPVPVLLRLLVLVLVPVAGKVPAQAPVPDPVLVLFLISDSYTVI